MIILWQRTTETGEDSLSPLLTCQSGPGAGVSEPPQPQGADCLEGGHTQTEHDTQGDRRLPLVPRASWDATQTPRVRMNVTTIQFAHTNLRRGGIVEVASILGTT